MSGDVAIGRLSASLRAGRVGEPPPLAGARLARLLERVAGERLERALHAADLPPGRWFIRRIDVPLGLDFDRSDTVLADRWARALAAALRREADERRDGVVRYADDLAPVADAIAGIAGGRTGRAWAWRRAGVLRAGDPSPSAEPGAAVLAILGRRRDHAAPVLVRAVEVCGVPRMDRTLGRRGWRELAGIVLPGGVPPAGPPDGWSARLAGSLLAGSTLAAAFTGARLRPDPETLAAWAVLVAAEADPASLRGGGAGPLVATLVGRLRPPGSRPASLRAAGRRDATLDGAPGDRAGTRGDGGDDGAGGGAGGPTSDRTQAGGAWAGGAQADRAGTEGAGRARAGGDAPGCADADDACDGAAGASAAVPREIEAGAGRTGGKTSAADGDGQARAGADETGTAGAGRAEPPGAEAGDRGTGTAPATRTGSPAVAEPPPPAPAEDGVPTAWAGLPFLLATAGAVGLPERATEEPAFAQRPLRWVLHATGRALVPVEPDDPALLTLAGTPADRGAALVNATSASRVEQVAVDRLARDWAMLTVARLATAADAVHAHDDEPEDPANGVHVLAHRRGPIVGAPGWLEVRLPMAQVNLRLRRAGLDIDPGWVPWLGTVVRYVYE